MTTSSLETTAAPPRRRARRRFLILGLVLAAVVVGVGMLLAPGSKTTPALSGPSGSMAPTFRLSPVEPGPEISLTSYRGRPLVLNFWASWCPPCRREMPLLARTALAEKGRVAFLGVDLNDQLGAARAFLRQVRVSYPSAFDGHGSLYGRYDVYGQPTTVFISATGRIVGRHVGEMQASTLTAALRQAFGIS